MFEGLEKYTILYQDMVLGTGAKLLSSWAQIKRGKKFKIIIQQSISKVQISSQYICPNPVKPLNPKQKRPNNPQIKQRIKPEDPKAKTTPLSPKPQKSERIPDPEPDHAHLPENWGKSCRNYWVHA